MALVICGGEVRDSTVERLEHAVRHADCEAPLYELGESAPASDTRPVASLGPGALEATRQLRNYAVRRAELRPRAGGRRSRVMQHWTALSTPIWGGEPTGMVSIFIPGLLRL